MPNEFASSMDRRTFLRLGALGGVVVSGGCGESGTPQTVTEPPAPKGNRALLQKAAEAGDAAAAKKKKKK